MGLSRVASRYLAGSVESLVFHQLFVWRARRLVSRRWQSNLRLLFPTFLSTGGARSLADASLRSEPVVRRSSGRVAKFWPRHRRCLVRPNLEGRTQESLA